jgi:hypothetical protein
MGEEIAAVAGRAVGVEGGTDDDDMMLDFFLRDGLAQGQEELFLLVNRIRTALCHRK